MSRPGRWTRESDAPEGDRALLVSCDDPVMVRCPLCGSAVELGYIADLMGIADAPDECPECGVQIRIKVEWREAVRA